jgi:hypothetical protein
MYLKSLSLGIIFIVLVASLSPAIAEINTEQQITPFDETDEIKENYNCIILAKITGIRNFDADTLLGRIAHHYMWDNLTIFYWIHDNFPLFFNFFFRSIFITTFYPLVFIAVFADQLYDSRTHGNLTFGHTVHIHEHNDEHNPSEGWVWTNGTEGTIYWEGKLYGRIKTLYGDSSSVYYYDYYTGATNFRGLKFRVNLDTFIIAGYADHVKLSTERPNN